MEREFNKNVPVEMGKRIRKRREYLGLSQEELALRMGFKGKGSISRIESGEHEVKQSKLPLLAKVLDTSIAYLMGWDELGNFEEASFMPLTEDEKKLLTYYRNMNEQGKISAMLSVKGMSEQELFKKESDIVSNG